MYVLIEVYTTRVKLTGGSVVGDWGVYGGGGWIVI